MKSIHCSEQAPLGGGRTVSNWQSDQNAPAESVP